MLKGIGSKWLRSLMVPAGLCSLLLPLTAAAELPWLTGPQIEKELAGRTIHGMYSSGRRFTEHYRAGGALEYVEDGILLTGRWSVTAGTLCTLYDTDPTGGCFRVLPSGNNCYEFYFVARDEDQAHKSEGLAASWTARGAVEGSPEACPEDANV